MQSFIQCHVTWSPGNTHTPVWGGWAAECSSEAVWGGAVQWAAGWGLWFLLQYKAGTKLVWLCVLIALIFLSVCIQVNKTFSKNVQGCRDGQKLQKLGVDTGHTNTAQITPSLHLFFHAHAMLFQVILEHNRRKMSLAKKRCRDGVICAVFVCPVSTPSFCSFWHCHPYIPEHFWKMFYLLV